MSIKIFVLLQQKFINLKNNIMKIKLILSTFLIAIFAIALSSCGDSLKKDAKTLGEKYCKMMELQKKAEAATSDEEKTKLEAEVKKIDEEGQKLSDEFEKKYSDSTQKKEFEKAFDEETKACK